MGDLGSAQIYTCSLFKIRQDVSSQFLFVVHGLWVIHVFSLCYYNS